ncbi:helix-turn-helix domain-containing protein [Flavobacterium sp. WC2509]|uniref:helix-turn-helix domain-containing protein n=1 Tax=Flavobacterium sp. WC2509 TaxID=3461406 RepID=UPI0040448B72
MSNTNFKHSFSLLHIDHVTLDNHWNYYNIVSPYYRLYYIDEGLGSISDNVAKHILEPGYLYLIPSFTLCNLNCDSHLGQYFIQFFEESADGINLFSNNRKIIKTEANEIDILLIKKMLQTNPGRGINRSDNPIIYEKEAYYKEYRSLNREMKNHLKFENQGILLQLISRFLGAKDFIANNNDTIPSKILNAISYIQVHLKDNPSIEELADRANQNKDYFSKQFLLHTGVRPLQYILEKKIERAQYLIATTDKTFLEIAIDTGFSNLPHFSKIFKRFVSLTPGEYRRLNKSTLF